MYRDVRSIPPRARPKPLRERHPTGVEPSSDVKKMQICTAKKRCKESEEDKSQGREREVEEWMRVERIWSDRSRRRDIYNLGEAYDATNNLNNQRVGAGEEEAGAPRRAFLNEHGGRPQSKQQSPPK